jgi:thiol-activated cytolysin
MRKHTSGVLVVCMVFIAGFMVLNLGCDSDPVVPESNSVTEINTYIVELPSWAEFCPPAADSPATPVGAAVDLPDTTLDLEVLGDSEAENSVIDDVVYSCRTQTYSMAQNPEKIVMFNPSANSLYAGALIQGKNHAEGAGSIQGLPIAQRAAIKISIPELSTGDNYREIVPSQATVDAARGEMVGDAVASDLATPSSISFKVDTYHSEQEWALSAGISGRYLGFKASASGSASQSAATTTICAYYYEKMFTVVAEMPQTPGAIFSKEFTKELLQDQVDLGRMGPDNLPVYVANVVYGRIMMFTMTSTASASEMEATLNAAYSRFGGGGSVELSSRQENILQNSQMTLASIGGPAEGSIATIQSGNWQDYFSVDAPLSTAVPISYTLVNLGDGSLAKVTEMTTYNVRECSASSYKVSFGGDDEADFLRPVVKPASYYRDYNFLFPKIAGDCDFHGSPLVNVTYLAPEVTDDEIALHPNSSLSYCYHHGDDSRGHLGLDSVIYRAPEGWRIVRVGGMTPQEWQAHAYFHNVFEDAILANLNPTFISLGNVFQARFIGDRVGEDFVDCLDPPSGIGFVADDDLPCGIYALKIEETEVELECIDCTR